MSTTTVYVTAEERERIPLLTDAQAATVGVGSRFRQVCMGHEMLIEILPPPPKFMLEQYVVRSHLSIVLDSFAYPNSYKEGDREQFEDEYWRDCPDEAPSSAAAQRYGYTFRSYEYYGPIVPVSVPVSIPICRECRTVLGMQHDITCRHSRLVTEEQCR